MTHRHSTRAAVAISIALAFFAAACSDKANVGAGVNTDIKGKLNELSTTTTTDPNATTTTAKVVAINTTATTAAPRTTATTAPKTTQTTADTAFNVAINGDNSGEIPFLPNQIGPIRVGGKVRFTNKDSKVRSVVSQDGGFRSPDLQPGQAWVYTASKPSAGARDGVFHLIDGTRNYATATMQVG